MCSFLFACHVAKRAAGSEKQVLGTSDIQSLADLANPYTVVNKMRVVPFGKETVIRTAVLVCLPLLPLTLTMIPLDQVLDRLVNF